MIKLNKKDWLNLLLIFIVFFLILLFINNSFYFNGSIVDFSSQHVSLPEYFRNLFYETKDLFPDFALNIGNGQNIYNFSYYGLLSPVILVSYFVPFINMTTYIIGSTIILIFISCILLYSWLKSKGYSSTICFICTLIFALASPITYHSHRHIMFISYMPFLFLALYGVDSYISKHKKSLLIISVFLMIMTSYYYSVCGIVVIFIYYVYLYLKNNKLSINRTLKDILSFVYPVFIGVLLSCIVIVPTFYCIMHNRAGVSSSISLLDLINPTPNLVYILYGAYGLGLSALSIISIINLIISKKKYNIFLGIILLLIICFPFINYILNAGMYIDSKILIPFLPLVILSVAHLLKEVFNKEVNYKYLILINILLILLSLFNKHEFALILTLTFVVDSFTFYITSLIYNKTNNKYYIIIPLTILVVSISILVSKTDDLVKYSKYKQSFKYESSIKYISNNDTSFYRINNYYDLNKIYSSNHYASSVYSSTSNMLYNKFYYDVMGNNVPSRNRTITKASSNIIFNTINSNKYLISKEKKEILGYTLYSYVNNMYIYINNSVFSLGYSMSNTINEKEFLSLDFPHRNEAVLKSIVTNKNTNYKDVSLIEDYIIKDNISYNNSFITKKESKYIIDAKEDISFNILLDKPLIDKVLFISFDILNNMDCSNNEAEIRINDISNKLTCKQWKYHNNNFNFKYVLSSNMSSLNIKIKKGLYVVDNINSYIMDYNYVKEAKGKVDQAYIDNSKTKGDKIVGNIKVREDGVFATTIPYDKGFHILLDGNKINYYKVNTAFVGFDINKGEHNIEIKYSSPYKKVGILLSVTGLILFIVSFIKDKRLKSL
ncbi:MAG: YfhO family protein [Bacilli bacterium]